MFWQHHPRYSHIMRWEKGKNKNAKLHKQPYFWPVTSAKHMIARRQLLHDYSKRALERKQMGMMQSVKIGISIRRWLRLKRQTFKINSNLREQCKHAIVLVTITRPCLLSACVTCRELYSLNSAESRLVRMDVRMDGRSVNTSTCVCMSKCACVRACVLASVHVCVCARSLSVVCSSYR